MPPALTDLQATMLPILWGALTLPGASEGDPASELAVARATDLDTAESMVGIRAARLLREAGDGVPGERRVFGVVLVVPLDEWVDVLAVYADGAIRYYNGAPPGTSATIVDGVDPTELTSALVNGAAAVLDGAPVQQVPAPVLELSAPTGTVFRSDGEQLGLLDQVPDGGDVLGAGIAVIQALDAMNRADPSP